MITQLRPKKGQPWGWPLNLCKPNKPSITRGRCAAPTKAVVQASLDRVFVVPEANGRDNASGAGEKCVPGAEVVILIFDFTRPVLGKQVYQTATDGVTVATAAAIGKSAAAEPEQRRRVYGRRAGRLRPPVFSQLGAGHRS